MIGANDQEGIMKLAYNKSWPSFCDLRMENKERQMRNIRRIPVKGTKKRIREDNVTIYQTFDI